MGMGDGVRYKHAGPVELVREDRHSEQMTGSKARA